MSKPLTSDGSSSSLRDDVDDSDGEMDDADDNDDDYYNCEDDTEMEDVKEDPEYFDYELLKVEDVDRLLNESVEALSEAICVSGGMGSVHGYTYSQRRSV